MAQQPSFYNPAQRAMDAQNNAHNQLAALSSAPPKPEWSFEGELKRLTAGKSDI
jgi:hypothetical protein